MKMFFDSQKLFHFMRSHLLILDLCTWAIGVLFSKLSPILTNSRIFPFFCSIILSVSLFSLRYLIRFDFFLCSVLCVRGCDLFFPWEIGCLQVALCGLWNVGKDSLCQRNFQSCWVIRHIPFYVPLLQSRNPDIQSVWHGQWRMGSVAVADQKVRHHCLKPLTQQSLPYQGWDPFPTSWQTPPCLPLSPAFRVHKRHWWVIQHPEPPPLLTTSLPHYASLIQ